MAKYMDGNGLSHFMSKIKEAIAATVTGVKGNAESTYRTGQVNITAVNVGAVDKSGDTMTGTLTLVGGRYSDDNATAALKLQNSNIIGVNSIYTADPSENAQEGIHFCRDSTHVDSIHAKAGNLYFTPNRALGSEGVPAEVLTRSGTMRYVEMQTTNPFAPGSLRGPYISKIDNAFYAADKRWSVSATLNGSAISANYVAYWFNGDYESRYQVAKSGTCVITMDFTNTTYFPGYPYGYILVSFYYNETPASVSGRVYCNYQSHGIGWHDIAFEPVADNGTYSCVYRSAHQGYYQISQLEITVVASDSVVAGISQIEMHLDRPYSGRNPFLSKYVAEELYYNLTAPSFTGDVTGGIRPATLRPTSANTTGYGGYLRYILATSSMTTGKPGCDGHILDMEWDNDGKWHGQLSVPNGPTNYVQWRTENGGTWTAWRNIFDDVHTVPVANGGTGQTTAINAANALINALSTGSSDPTDADYYISQYVGGGTTTTTYHRRPMSALWNYIKGKFTSTMLSSATNSSSEELAATPKAVKAAYDLASSANTTAGQAMSAATGALAFKVTYSVSGSTVTCAAHVYSAGQEVTSNHADSCFVWSMSLNGGTSWTSLGTGKTKAVTAITAFGGNVKCDFTPAS